MLLGDQEIGIIPDAGYMKRPSPDVSLSGLVEAFQVKNQRTDLLGRYSDMFKGIRL